MPRDIFKDRGDNVFSLNKVIYYSKMNFYITANGERIHFVGDDDINDFSSTEFDLEKCAGFCKEI